MPDLLLELFSEEIPARMQRQATEDLKRLVTDALVEQTLVYEGAQAFATPRRLALHVVGLPAKQADRHEARRGPRVGAPDAALAGFVKSSGLARIEDARIEKDGKGVEFYVAHLRRPGRDAVAVIAELLPPIIRNFPWPKSMHWGDYRAPASGAGASSGPGGYGVGMAYASLGQHTLRWVRPLHSILCTFSSPHETPETINFEIDGLSSGDLTFGHRFMAPAPIVVKRFDDYVASLAKAKVVLDLVRRKQIIAHDARDLAMAQGLELIEDEALLEEVAGLVEWPVVLIGAFEPAFLELPPEAIRAMIRANQKCFVLKDAQGGLANKFILVSNLIASDGGKAIAAGNARVVRARLSDARHFWRTDLAPLPDYKDKAEKPLDQRLAKLRALGIVFHAKLWTQGERVDRIAALARELAPLVGADPALAERAALLAKADLVTEMVGEFPELQGLMGRYYASAQGEPPEVAAAIEEHYKPQGPGDRVPSAPTSIAVALADKLDTLVGFWAIDEKPTGSKDPYALRRAALGVIRVVLESEIRLPLQSLIERGIFNLLQQQALLATVTAVIRVTIVEQNKAQANRRGSDLLAFFADRLKVYLRDKGARHDLIDAVFALPGQDDLLMIVRRVEALGRFLETEDGKNLLAGYRRAANILRAEEKKDGAGAFEAAYAPGLLAEPAEKALANALDVAGTEAAQLVGNEDFEGAMRALSALRAPVDAFFLDVTVNADDPALRLNRLRLLSELRRAVHNVADFGRIGG